MCLERVRCAVGERIGFVGDGGDAGVDETEVVCLGKRREGCVDVRFGGETGYDGGEHAAVCGVRDVGD